MTVPSDPIEYIIYNESKSKKFFTKFSKNFLLQQKKYLDNYDYIYTILKYIINPDKIYKKALLWQGPFELTL